MPNRTRRLLALRGLLLLSAAVATTAGAAPVAGGFERFFPTSLTELEAGQLLLGELNCVACHAPTAETARHLFPRTAPDLSAAGSRLHPSFLPKWIAAPSRLKPGTIMPDLLAGATETERARDTAALSAFLLSLHDQDPAPHPPRRQTEEQGRELFESIGCSACHRIDTPANPSPDTPSPAVIPLNLTTLSTKYTPAGLAAFLLNPLAVRPAGRMPRTPMTPEEAKIITTYLIQPQPPAPAVPVDPSLARQGQTRFIELGCSACHALKLDGVPLQPSPPATPLSSLARASSPGCLSPQPVSGLPFYNLKGSQRQALKHALVHLAKAPPPSAARTVRLHMTALNCFACHQRGELGGIDERLKPYFRTTGQDLEDEGRFPPSLTGVGRKLTPSALTAILQGRGAIRPYMTTRMPDFGPQHARDLSARLLQADHDPGVKPTPRDGRENEVGRNMWGRGLIGTKGLGCITCHRLNGHKSLGIQALDLASAPGRLQPEWFRDYLLNPARFRPGTRMPSFWPEGTPTLKGFGGTTERQIDSLWAYLNELDQSRLPVGLEDRKTFELHPVERPIVFRTFMEHAGTHAIAVGFPQGIHAAFDSKNIRWAALWKGRFLDAESTWDDRFTPLTEPLGDSLLLLPRENPLAAATGPTNDARRSFLGYRLDPKGIPTLLYRIGAWRIEDRMEPAELPGTFIQTLNIQGPDGNLSYHLPPAPLADALSVVSSAPQQHNQIQLRVDQDKAARLILRWSW